MYSHSWLSGISGGPTGSFGVPSSSFGASVICSGDTSALSDRFG